MTALLVGFAFGFGFSAGYAWHAAQGPWLR